jgi:hypothetical protein
MSKKLILVILLLPFISCDVNDPIEKTQDELLVDQLIGSWQSTEYWPEKVIFHDDGTFVDTFFTYFNSEPHVLRNSYSYEGNYSVIDGILTIDNVIMTGGEPEWRTTLQWFVVGIYQHREIASIGAVLNLKPFFKFSPIENNCCDIDGKWEAKSLLIAFEQAGDPQYKGGFTRIQYDFRAEDSTYTYLNVDSFENRPDSSYYEGRFTTSEDYIFFLDGRRIPYKFNGDNFYLYNTIRSFEKLE